MILPVFKSALKINFQKSTVNCNRFKPLTAWIVFHKSGRTVKNDLHLVKF